MSATSIIILKILAVVQIMLACIMVYGARNNQGLFHFLIGLFTLSAVAGLLLGTILGVFMNTYYPYPSELTNITDLKETEEYLNQLSEPNKEASDENLDELNRKQKRWLLFLFLAYYVFIHI